MEGSSLKLIFSEIGLPYPEAGVNMQPSKRLIHKVRLARGFICELHSKSLANAGG